MQKLYCKPYLALVVILWVLTACTAPSPTPPPPPTATLLPGLPPPTVTAAPTPLAPASPVPGEPTPLPPTATAIPTSTPIPSPTPIPTPPQTVIMIVVDALRPDHLSAYGYARDTSPQVAAWFGAEGARCDNAISVSPWTLPSNAALLTGYAPSQLGLAWEYDATLLPDSAHTLIEYFHEAGYYTAGFSTPVLSTRRGFEQGFDFFTVVGPGLGQRWDDVPAEKVNQEVLNWLQKKWLRREQSQPLFLYLYYLDSHTWYTPPAPYDTRYDADYTGALTGAAYAHGKDVVGGAIVPTARDVEHLIALYDGEIAYWDAQLGALLETLNGMGVLDDALLVLTADHGEMFGEHGQWLHRSSLYEEVLRVPLLFRSPGRIAPGLVLTAPLPSLALMPTLLDLANIPLPAELQPLSLRHALTGAQLIAPHDVFSEMDGVTDTALPGYWISPREDIRAIRRDHWKLIHYPHDPALDELYALHPTSPYERENVIGAEAARAAALLDTLRAHFGLSTP